MTTKTVCAAVAIMLAIVAGLLWPLAIAAGGDRSVAAKKGAASNEEPHRSPIALALSADGARLLAANQTAGSVSLVNVRSERVLDELKTGDKPAGVAISRDGRRGVVTHWYGYDLAVLALEDNHITLVAHIAVGPEPRGVALSADGKTAYVAVGVANEVVRVDLDRRKVTGRLAVGREPRGIALSPNGSRLLVSNARSQNVSIIDPRSWAVLHTLPIDGDNLRQVVTSADGKSAYAANMRNRGFPTTRNNIDLGWVLGQRLTRIDLEGSPSYATLSLDVRGTAAADAHGAAVSRDGKFVAASCGGTHEVMIFRTDLKPLPWRLNSSRNLIAPELLKSDGRFRRVTLGGRPTEIVFAPDGKTLFVANYLGDSIQVVDAEKARLEKTIPLGGPKTPSLEHRGEIVFYDARHSFNQWYSCNTCHSDGHTNGLDFDTQNDGRQDLSTFHVRSRKKVPTLRRTTKTKPWTWHGWQSNLDDAMLESFTKSMQGPAPIRQTSRRSSRFLTRWIIPRARTASPKAGSLRLPSTAKPSFARRRPLATPATAALNSPTARSILRVSKSATTPIAVTTPPRCAAFMIRTPTFTTAAPRLSATP